MSQAAWGVGLCAVAGAVCLWAAVREMVLLSRLRRHGLRTEGVVVGRERTSAEESWVPVIEFIDDQGRRTEFRPRVSGVGLALEVGRRVPVVHLPHKPDTARVFTRRYRVASVLITSIGGAVFLGVAALIATTKPM